MLWHFCSKRKSYQSVISQLSTIQFLEAMSNKRSARRASLLDDFKIPKRLVIVKYKVHHPTECSFPDLTISKFVVTKIFSLQKLIPNVSHIHKETFLPTIRLFCPSWQASKLTGSLSINRKQAPVLCAKRALLPREVILFLAALFCSYFRIIYHQAKLFKVNAAVAGCLVKSKEVTVWCTLEGFWYFCLS